MIERRLARLLERHHFAERDPKMAFVVGPRQCGKTTLARALQEARGSPDLYRNWDDFSWRHELSLNPYGFADAYRPRESARPLAVLDEIHKFPQWKRYVKGLWDTRRSAMDLLVTGSGRLDIYRRGGDSLLGRYHQYRLHPFSVSELLGKDWDPDRDTPERVRSNLLSISKPGPEREVFATVLRFGGFPDPFLRQTDRYHRRWLRERKERLVREDLRDLTRIQMLSSIEKMIELLQPRIGSLLSLNNLRQDLGVSMESVTLWLEQLERLYYCFRIRPYAAKLSRALSREPKLYLFDVSEVADEGKRFENAIAVSLLSWCHHSQDWGQETLDLRFVRDKERREVDFLVTKEGKPFLLVEAKLSDPSIPDALPRFAEKLGGVPALVVVAHLDRPGTAKGFPVLPAAGFLAAIP